MGPDQSSTERESQPETTTATIDSTNPCWKGTQSLAALYLDATEHFGYQALGLHEQASQLPQLTPWASLLKSQREFFWRYFDGSMRIARIWWQLEPTETEAEKTGSSTI